MFKKTVSPHQGLDSELDSEISSLFSYNEDPRRIKNLHLVSPLEYAALLKQVRPSYYFCDIGFCKCNSPLFRTVTIKAGLYQHALSVCPVIL